MKDDLIGSLLLLIVQFTGGPEIKEQPVLSIVSHETLHRLCRLNCTAAYVSNTVYIPEDLDLTDKANHGILFHELVHFYQDTTKRWVNTNLCQQYNDREREAYSLQNLWYSHNDISQSVKPYFRDCYKK